MAGVTPASDDETCDKVPNTKPQAEVAKDDAESEGEEEEASEFEIEAVLDAKRGYFPEVQWCQLALKFI